jgi:hypothetical protein
MEKVLAQGAPQFQDCGRLLPRPKTNKELAVEMTFRLAPSGELEGLWLEPKTPGDQAFYDCVFHVVEKMAFPPTHDRSSTEVQQRLVFRVKPARKGP